MNPSPNFEGGLVIMEQIGLKELLVGIVALGQIVGVIVLFRGADALVSIREHLAKLNGRIGTCEELRKVHDKSDQDRHDSCEERLHDVEKSLIGLKGS